MSTHYYISRMRKGVRLARLVLLSVLGVLCIALQMLLFSSSPVLASSVYRAANAAPPEPPKNVARAGVSVVRLLVTYMTIPTAPSTTRTAIHCTGLGVLVASWPSRGATDQNNWVLTDGVLVNSSGDVTCGSEPAHPKAKLTSITIVMSSIYNPQGVVFPLLAPIISPLDVRCSAGVACADGAVLFAFSTTQTHTLPFIDLVSSGNGPSSLIALVKSATDLSVPSPSTTDQGNVFPDATAMTQFITPVQAATGTPAAVNEPGMPEVDADGHLVDMRLKSGTLVAAPSITDLLKQQLELRTQPSNPVHDEWNAGITAFYQGPSHYTEAKKHFNAVRNSNSQFQGVQPFLLLMSPSLTAPANTSGKTGEGMSFFGIPIPGSLVPVLWGVVILLLVILAIVIIVGVRVRRHARELREFEKEFAEAERVANTTLEEERRKQRQAWTQQQAQTQRAWPEQPSRVPETVPFASTRLGADQPPSSDPLCPNCGKPAPRSAKYCPSCRWLLLPSKSEAQPSIQLPATGPVRPDAVAEPRVPASLPTLPAPEQPQRSEPSTPLYPAGLPPLPVPARDVVENKPKEVARANDRVGQRLGNYRLVRLLGYGAFADVYLGEHRFLKTQAAIKVLQKRLTRDALVKFLAEARTIADLVHPHIVRVLEFGVEGSEPDIEQSVSDGEAIVDGIPFLVMDYAPGGTLRKRHPKGTRLPPATIIPYVMQVTEALQYAHGKKLIHRDVKAENILIGRGGEILLSDFGIAAVAHSEGSMTTQEMAGTVPYMAPEQIRGLPRPASDQYALGVVVYEWLCGTRPFNGASIEVIMQHMTLSPPRLCERVPSLSPKVEEVVLKALAKDPLQRFESVQAFANALREAIE